MSYQPIRNRIYHILEPHRKGDHLSRAFDLFLIILILLNTVAVMASTVESLHRQWHPQLYAFEIFSVAVFTLEYVARVWSATSAPQTASYRRAPYSKSWQQRLRYMFTPMALVDLAAILPFYLSMFIAFDLRILRLLRLTRLIKLGRYSRSVNLLYTVIRKELRVLAAAVSCLYFRVWPRSVGAGAAQSGGAAVRLAKACPKWNERASAPSTLRSAPVLLSGYDKQT